MGRAYNLNFPSKLVLHPTDNFLYDSAKNDHAIVCFEREEGNGELTLFQIVEDNQNGVEGINEISTIAINFEGTHLYAGGKGESSMAILEIDPGTGQLTFLDYVEEGVGLNEGLEGIENIQLSEDDRFIYTVDEAASGIGVYYNCLQENLVLDAGPDLELICSTSILTINTQSSGGNQLSFDWSNMDGNILSGSSSPFPEVDASGTYFTTMSSQPFGCALTDTLIVTEAPNDLFATGISTPNINDESNGIAAVIPDNGLPSYTYLWEDDLNTTDSLLTDLNPGFYSVSVTDANSCTVVVLVEVDVINPVEEIASNSLIEIFPNPIAESMNLRLELDQISDLRIQLISESGSVVWQATHYRKSLQIAIPSNQFPPGIYFCQIRFNGSNWVEKVVREQVKNNLPILLALFSSYFVKNTRHNYGYACVFCLV